MIQEEHARTQQQWLIRDQNKEIDSLREEVASLNTQLEFVVAAYRKQLSNLESKLEEYRG
jgi:hypothetical protein